MDHLPISMFGSKKPNSALNRLLMTSVALVFPFVGLILAQQAVQRQPKVFTFSPASVLRQETIAPRFALKDLNGRTVRLSDYRGKVVLINFWATWCPPCRAEMPDLVRLQRQHGKDGLQIIGVTYPPEKKARVRRFARSLKVNYPIILGTREFKARFSSEETLPLTVVINRDGKVSEIISGILLREEFDEKIKPLLIKEN